jgi:DNA-binding NarL/FixJ family response regulator
MEKIKILLADDHTILREGIKVLLNREIDMEVVAEAEDGVQALEKVRQEKPDVVVMDISMPKISGLDATKEITETFPDTKVVILTMHDNEEYLVQALKSGAKGYVLKEAAATDLAEAIRAVIRGDAYLYPAVARKLVDDYVNRVRTIRTAADSLTPREREVLKLVAEGHTNKEIADFLGISIKTVENHRTNLMRKLDLHDRTELARYAIKIGLVEA